MTENRTVIKIFGLYLEKEGLRDEYDDILA